MKFSTRDLAIAGLLGSLTALLGLTPIGFIPFPTPAGHATTMHIPPIVAGIIEGPIIGALVGFIFGLLSWTRASIPIFKDPLIAFLPRIFIGVVAYYVYRAMGNKKFAYGASLVMGIVSLAALRNGFSHLNEVRISSFKSWGTLIFPSFIFPLLLLILAIVIAWGGSRKTETKGFGIGAAAVAGTLTNTVCVLSLAVLRKYLPLAAAYFVGLTHGIPEIILAVLIVVPVVVTLNKALKREE